MTLLIVNDAVITADTMKQEIPWKDYGIDQVYAAYQADGARACMRQHPVDILLCDIEMPRENGIELLRWVRQEYPETECMFLTCHASFEYARDALSLGCSEYILMPARYEDIGKGVKRAAERLREKRQEEVYRKMGQQMMRETIRDICEVYGEKSTPADFVKSTESYIAEHLCESSLSVNECAERLHLHPVYLNRIFKNEKKCSISQYIVSEKMKLAERLLSSGKLNANAVAEKLGYQGYSNFRLMFKKYYGMSPRQYQEQKMRQREQEQ